MAKKFEGETTDKGQEASEVVVRLLLILIRLGFTPPDILTAIGQAAAILNVIFADTQDHALENAHAFGEALHDFAGEHFKDQAQIMADFGVTRRPDKGVQ